MTGLNEAMLRKAYAGKRVFLTGHTGFKGAWMTLWLRELGADVTGYALAPETSPSVFALAGVEKSCRHNVADIRDRAKLGAALREANPDFVFHLAAQALVRRSYAEPLETLDTNVMGTAYVLDAVRQRKVPCNVVIVTSDKCYENNEWVYGYRETDPMGGHDVYSMSKGAAELVVSSYRKSFFPVSKLSEHGVAVASARAGNCIGGGDWSLDRLVPDAIQALAAGRSIPVRNPRSVRPWQHLLEPVGGYLLLGARLAGIGGAPADVCSGWNFGPALSDTLSVRQVVDALVGAWGSGRWEDQSNPNAVHEAGLLQLSTDKAYAHLGWTPRWSAREAIQKTVDWYKAHYAGAAEADMRTLTVQQIRDYMGRSQA